MILNVTLSATILYVLKDDGSRKIYLSNKFVKNDRIKKMLLDVNHSTD